MLRGIYTSSSGMLVQWNNQNVLSNNLANVDTTGFKRDVATTQSFPTVPIHRVQDTYFKTYFRKIDLRPQIGHLGTGAMSDETHVIHTPGRYRETTNKLDMAIKGDGFFTLQTPRGIRYTRDGAFSLSAQGEIVNYHGDFVLGQRGVIVVRGGSFTVDEKGGVHVDGELIDTLRIVHFPDLGGLEKIGDNLFNAQPRAGIPYEPVNFEIMQGFLETSNVNSIREMAEMINIMRAYEANQRMLSAQDQTLDKIINEVGRAV